jgi:hypothetical protein
LGAKYTFRLGHLIFPLYFSGDRSNFKCILFALIVYLWIFNTIY